MAADPEGARKDHAPVRQFPDRALRWLLESPWNLRGLLLAAYPQVADRIDFGRVQNYPASFVSESFQEREADVVRRAPYRTVAGEVERELWIYVLVEHQSTPDRWMPFRLLLAMVHLWEMERRDQAERGVAEREQRLSPILPLVFYTGRREWDGPGALTDLVDVPEELRPFVPMHQTVYLDVTRGPEERLHAGGDPFGWVLRLLREEHGELSRFVEVERGALEAIRGLFSAADLERARVLLHFLVALIRHRRERSEQEVLLKVAREALVPVMTEEEVQAMGKTYGEELIEEGRAIGLAEGQAKGKAEGEAKGEAKGKAEGKAEGVIEGKRQALLAFLRVRFGALPESFQTRVLALGDMARLDELLRQAASANSVDELRVE